MCSWVDCTLKDAISKCAKQEHGSPSDKLPGLPPNLNARTRERLPTCSVTATSCNPSPTFPQLHPNTLGLGQVHSFVFACLCLCVACVGCLLERLRWSAVGALRPQTQWQPLATPLAVYARCNGCPQTVVWKALQLQRLASVWSSLAAETLLA